MKTCKKCNEDKLASEFYKHKANKDGLQGACKTCDKAINAKWAKDNPEKRNASKAKYAVSEGYCVYKATFPSGLYIGSGLTTKRRENHLNGSSTISLKLGEQAISFQALVISTKENCALMEAKLIASYGLPNLLNTYQPKAIGNSYND